jgi:hypothetical protein
MSFQNRGIVVGRITGPDGKPADGANVFIASVQLASGYTIPMRKIIIQSDDGTFKCPFVWDDWDGFSHDLSYCNILVGAFIDDRPTTEHGRASTMIAKGLMQVHGFLQRDVPGLVAGALTPDLDSIAGLADAGSMILDALEEWNGMVPMWAWHHLASSAHWMIIGGGVLRLTR